MDYMYDDCDGRIESDEYIAVKELDEENIIMIGEIGYYYPARVWMGNSGRIICTHDYEGDVRVFNSIIELISYELTGHMPNSIAMKE